VIKLLFEDIKSKANLITFFAEKGYPIDGNQIYLTPIDDSFIITKKKKKLNNPSQIIKDEFSYMKGNISNNTHFIIWEKEKPNFILIRRNSKPFYTHFKASKYSAQGLTDIYIRLNNLECDKYSYEDPLEFLFHPLYRVLNTDYRVNLEFAYIPKNCYDSKVFFRLINSFLINSTDVRIRDIFKEQTILSKITNDIPINLTPRKSSKTNRGPIEEIRDCFDFAASMNLLTKTYNDDKNYVYNITDFGREICDGIFVDAQQFLPDKLESEDVIRLEKFHYLLINYGINNPTINLSIYPQYAKFNVRPYYVLLKILNYFDKNKIDLKLKPVEIGYAVLSIINETEKEIDNSIQLCKNFNEFGYFNSGNFKLLEDYLSEYSYNDKNGNSIPYNVDAFKKRTNNLYRRLLGWAFGMGWINLRISDVSNTKDLILIDPIHFLTHKYSVYTVFGIREKGKEILNLFKDTTYMGVSTLQIMTKITKFYEFLNNSIKKSINQKDINNYLSYAQKKILLPLLKSKGVLTSVEDNNFIVQKKVIYYSNNKLIF